MPINKSLDCKHKVEALSLQDLTSSRLAFEKCDQWNWDFSDSPIQPKGWLLHRQEDRCLGKFHLARLVVASERKQSCAHTLTKSIEKCIFHSISNLMQTQELEKCHNHTSLGQNYSLREFLSCIHTKSKTLHGVCVWLGIPPTTGTCKLTFLSLKATPKSALCAHSALYTLYSFISHRGSSDNFIPNCYVHYASTRAGKTARMGNCPLRSCSYQLSSCNTQVPHTPTWRSANLCLKNSVTSSNRRAKQTYFRDP